MSTPKIVCSAALACGVVATAQAQTVIYDNTTIQTTSEGVPIHEDTVGPMTGGIPGIDGLVRKAYLEDATIAGGGALKEVSFSVFNANELLGNISNCFGNSTAPVDVYIYADPDGLGPDADGDGQPDPDRLIAYYLNFVTDNLPCAFLDDNMYTVDDVGTYTVDISRFNAEVEDGDRLWVWTAVSREGFRQVQAGSPTVGSTLDGYYLADPTVDPPESGLIRFSNLYLQLTAGTAFTIPANDDCANATAVSEGMHPFRTIAATTDGPADTGCIPGGVTAFDDVWFLYTAPATGNVTIDVCNMDVPFDSVLAVYDATGGCPTSASAIACNDDLCGVQSKLRLPVTAGHQYYIQIGSFSELDPGQGTLAISSAVPAPANDDCVNAQVVNLGTTNGDNTGAAGDDITFDGACGRIDEAFDVWYEFTAPSAGLYTFDTCGSVTDVAMQIWNNCPSQLGLPLECVDGMQACNTMTTPVLDLANGETVKIRVAGIGGAEGPFVLNIGELSLPCPCDVNGVDDVNFFDLLDYLDLWFGSDPAADFNMDLTVNFFDLLDFLDCWFAASSGDCPAPDLAP